MLLYTPSEDRSPEDHIRLRLRVWRRRTRLDATLAEGHDPAEDPALALRADQLTRTSTRLALARTLRNLLDAAEEPPGAWRMGDPRPPLQREALLAAREDLLALADRLTRPDDVPPQVAALTALMIWDLASPVYATNTEESVVQWAEAATGALETGR